MPQCKAKFCTVKRGEGISTFAIPDPKGKRSLCQQWIHNLGIKNLDIKTYVYSKQNIVCEKHFEEDCFIKEKKRGALGEQRKYKRLKPDAVPTIFADSKSKKRRVFSERRIERKEKEEAITGLINENNNHDNGESMLPTEIPSQSTDGQGISLKRKVGSKRKAGKKQKKRKEESLCKTKDIGTQTSDSTCEIGISCNIQTDHSNTISCSNCYARDHPAIVMSDHSYMSKPQNKDTHSLSKQESCYQKTDPKESENDAADSGQMWSSDDDDNQINLKTPTKEYKNDPTYEPSPTSDYSPVVSQLANREDKKTVQDTKYIVFFSSLKKLFTLVHCSICNSAMDTDDMHSHTDGTCLTVTFTCMQGHEFKWRSQPMFGQQPAGNVLATAAVTFTGNTFAKMESFCKTFKLAFFGRTTFHKLEKTYVIPSIHRLWMQQKDIITGALKSHKLIVSGDGRCDSPGYNAKYCTYTIMEAHTSAIIGFNVVQVSEADYSSSKMELIGFKRTMQDLKKEGMEIQTIATDRHVQIRKYIKDEYPAINHQFDVWHLAKNVRKKLTAVANKKENIELMPWVKRIANHLWFCASQCRGDSDLLVEMWTSIVWHIQNVHSFDGEKFQSWAHEPLASEDIRKKKWLKNGSKPLKALELIVCDKRLLKDIRQLNLFCHTGDLETYHSMMLKYVPKRQAFGYTQMVARTQLAALDHNFNLKREVAVDAQGNPSFSVMLPKATGRWSVRQLYVAKSYDFRQELMNLVTDSKLTSETEVPHQEYSKSLPRNIAPVAAPSKSSLVEAHVSRFKTS